MDDSQIMEMADPVGDLIQHSGEISPACRGQLRILTWPFYDVGQGRSASFKRNVKESVSDLL
jgi:hypothetical protein